MLNEGEFGAMTAILLQDLTAAPDKDVPVAGSDVF